MKTVLFSLLSLLTVTAASAAEIEVAKGKSVVKCVVKEGGPSAAAEASAELTSALNNLQVQVTTSDSSAGEGFTIVYTVRPPFKVSQPDMSLVEIHRTGEFVATVCVTITKE